VDTSLLRNIHMITVHQSSSHPHNSYTIMDRGSTRRVLVLKRDHIVSISRTVRVVVSVSEILRYRELSWLQELRSLASCSCSILSSSPSEWTVTAVVVGVRAKHGAEAILHLGDIYKPPAEFFTVRAPELAFFRNPWPAALACTRIFSHAGHKYTPPSPMSLYAPLLLETDTARPRARGGLPAGDRLSF
jgi:hypothetical protein